MSSALDTHLIVLLSNASTQLNRYFGIFTFFFGVVGHILNIAVLSQKPLRSNSCAWLFLVSSFAYLLSILTGLIPRILITWNMDISSTNRVLCKLRVFIFFTSITVGFWIVMLATVDRWLSSCIDINRRQRSTLKNAQRGALVIIVVSTIIEVQELICFEANLTNTPLKCYTSSVLCGIISDMFFALVSILFPLLLMLIFGLKIISNVRQTQSRLQPIHTAVNTRTVHHSSTGETGRPSQQKKTDRQLLVMLLFQVLFMFLFSFPFALSKIYTTTTRNSTKSSLRITAENFIFSACLLLLLTACGMPFFIYTLSGGSVFRKVLLSLPKMLGQKMTCRCK